jgi:hypothetical protein
MSDTRHAEVGWIAKTETDARAPQSRAVFPPVRARVLRAVVIAFSFLAAGLDLEAASFTAKLDEETVVLGDSVTLSLICEGGSPQAIPQIPTVANLQMAYAGESSEYKYINGQTSSRLLHTFRLTPLKVGEYTIPAIKAVVDGQTLTSQPLKLKVTKGDAGSGQVASGAGSGAFLKLVVPRNEIYLGEILPLEIRLYAQQGQLTQLPQLNEAGFTAGKMSKPSQTRARVNGQLYDVVVFKTSVSAAKTGSLTLGPATMPLKVPKPNARRTIFGDVFDWREVMLTSDPQPLQVLPLPTNNIPAGFSGAVGSYTLAYSVSPTNIAVGEPILVKVQISGRGAYDGLSLPPQAAWREFKTYPPTSKVESSDPLGLEGAKIFEQTVVPENTEAKELPPFVFSFFDPERKQYVALNQPAVPLLVRPSSATVQPIVQLTPSAASDATPTIQDIMHIKTRLGTVGTIQPPVARQPWFLGLQTIPVLAWLAATIWRRRADRLANNPRLRRQRQVAKLVRDGLQELRHQAAANQGDEFYATVFRLLQEQLGERLDLPASAITEAVIEERLRPRGVAAETLATLHDLFQACNQAKYAPQGNDQDLAGLLAKVESALRELPRITT